LVFLRINEKDISFSTPGNSDAYRQLFREWGSRIWYSRSGKMSLFDKLILEVCLLHPVFLSDVLSKVIGVTSNYSGDSALSNCHSNIARLTIHVSFLRQKVRNVSGIINLHDHIEPP